MPGSARSPRPTSMTSNSAAKQHIQHQLQQELQQLQEQQQQRVINPTHPNIDLIKRCKKKFEKLEETCMERYVAREQRVISTLNFCMTALEQLRSWAVFAIFPLDEQHSDKYVLFVEQRYSCVVVPLRLFLQALQREQNHQPIIANHRGTPGSPRSGGGGDYGSRDSSGRNSPTRNSPRDSIMSGSSLSGSFGAGGGFDFGNQRLGSVSPTNSLTPLKERINLISHKYLQEGVSIKDLVVQRLLKCRKELRTIYRWGQASLMDLHDIFDEALSDELYYMVRGKMARVLSAISVFEEAADQIEKNLSSQLSNETNMSYSYEEDMSPTAPVPPPRSRSAMEVRQMEKQEKRKNPLSRSMTKALEEMANGYDLTVDLEPLTVDNDDDMMSSTGSFMGSLHLNLSNGSGSLRFTGERTDQEIEILDGDGGSTRSGSGSTPEPPGSPRPRYLGSHPKIMKDKLQSLALPSKFPAAPSPRANTW